MDSEPLRSFVNLTSGELHSMGEGGVLEALRFDLICGKNPPSRPEMSRKGGAGSSHFSVRGGKRSSSFLFFFRFFLSLSLSLSLSKKEEEKKKVPLYFHQRISSSLRPSAFIFFLVPYFFFWYHFLFDNEI